ncbi:ECI1 [Bugula neritina]|uniref:Enoyl-CoA delta isomerase 1, mitochondrial n=1 Tax=Bugula neritina TaxID=10212 RepID=A0A7J7JCP9_BUGNE|nr:ECI1 [Bugula neritina]
MSMASKSMLNAQALARSRLSYRCYNHLSKIHVGLGSTPYSTKNSKVTASHQAHSLLSPCKLLSQQKATARKFSQRSLGQDNLLDVSVDSSSGVATLKMQKPPVNSFSLEFLTSLCINLDKLHSDGCRGLVIGSSLPKIFSAGLEITEMYQPDEARLREFWRTLQEFWIKLYGSQMITIAAITGHSPAGGCLVSMCCDHRVMADGKLTIGLNETLLGIVAPRWFSDTLINTVGHREAERALQLGKLYSPQEAVAVGLVDQVVPLESVAATVESTMAQWLKIPSHARHLSKLQLRQPTLDRLLHTRQEDIDNFVSFITKESIQKSLGMYLAALKQRSKAK